MLVRWEKLKSNVQEFDLMMPLEKWSVLVHSLAHTWQQFHWWTIIAADVTSQVPSHESFIRLRKKQSKLEGKYSLESTDPHESEIRAHLGP